MAAKCNTVIDMSKTAHEEWLLELIGTDSMRTAAQKTQYAQTTISRQLSRGNLSPEMVIALCRAYDRSPVQGLIETEYINDYEVEGPDVAIALDKATNQQLLDQIMKRSDPHARYLFGGDEETIGLSPHLTAVSDDADMNDGTVRDFDYAPEEYAADSSIDETEARLERGEDIID